MVLHPISFRKYILQTHRANSIATFLCSQARQKAMLVVQLTLIENLFLLFYSASLLFWILNKLEYLIVQFKRDRIYYVKNVVCSKSAQYAWSNKFLKKCTRRGCPRFVGFILETRFLNPYCCGSWRRRSISTIYL